MQVEERVAGLNAKLQDTQNRKSQLESEVDMCQKKLARAGELISGLGGEKARWTQVTKTLAESAANVVGDALLAAAYISYLGPFSASFRCVVYSERSTRCATSQYHDRPVFVQTSLLGLCHAGRVACSPGSLLAASTAYRARLPSV